jgi:hypothetical protein
LQRGISLRINDLSSKIIKGISSLGIHFVVKEPYAIRIHT